MGVKYYKRTKTPKYTEKQLREIPPKCRLLRRKILKGDKIIIMDDEKYFTFSNSSDITNKGFYTANKKSSPENIKFIKKMKFEPKVLVWCCISEKGVSSVWVQTQSGIAVKSSTYIKKCLPNLIKFIKKHHANDEIIFWPDLASSHYSFETQNWLKERNINFVPKKANPPNIPGARPIENFWSILSQHVYKDGWEAKSADQLKKRIVYCAKKVDVEVVQKMMRGVKGKLRKIEDGGPLAIM